MGVASVKVLVPAMDWSLLLEGVAPNKHPKLLQYSILDIPFCVICILVVCGIDNPAIDTEPVKYPPLLGTIAETLAIELGKSPSAIEFPPDKTLLAILQKPLLKPLKVGDDLFTLAFNKVAVADTLDIEVAILASATTLLPILSKFLFNLVVVLLLIVFTCVVVIPFLAVLRSTSSCRAE